MKRTHSFRLAGWLAAAVLFLSLPAAWAQTALKGAEQFFPGGKGIRMIIPYPPGGGNDTFGRFLVHGLNEGFIKAGRVRALAVTAPARLKAFPDVPTMAEAGVPDCEAGPFWGVAAPAKTPKGVIAKLNTEFNRILGTAELRKHFANEDVQVAGGSPEQFDAFLRKEVTLWGRVIREAKIRAE